jgi:hypothetical protein
MKYQISPKPNFKEAKGLNLSVFRYDTTND